MNKRSAILLLSISLVILVIGIQLQAGLVPLAPPMSYSLDMLSEQDLLARSRDRAQKLGLIGEPTEITYALMSIGSYLTMTETPTTSENLAFGGETRETPIFVYQVKGNIPQITMFGSAYSENGYEYLVIRLDPRTGDIRGFTAIRTGNEPLDLARIPADRGDPDLAPIDFTPNPPPLDLTLDPPEVTREPLDGWRN